MPYGGGEKSIANTAEVLSKNGYEVAILAANASEMKKYIPEGVKFIGVDTGVYEQNPMELKNRIELVETLYNNGIEEAIEYNPDIVISHAYMGAKFLEDERLKGFKIYWDSVIAEWMIERGKQSGIDINYGNDKIIELEQIGLNNADQIVVLSNEVKEWVEKKYKKNVVVIPRGIDADKYQYIETTKKFDEKLVIGYFGRLNRELKGFKVLVEAVRKIHEKGIDAEVHVYGPHQPQINGDGIIYKGYINKEEKMCKAYRSVDVVVVPSYVESFGRVCAEAMMCGAPVIVSSVGGLKDQVVWEEQLFKPGNSDELAAKLIEYYKNRESRYHEWGSREHKRALENYSAEKVGEAILSLMEKIEKKINKVKQI